MEAREGEDVVEEMELKDVQASEDSGDSSDESESKEASELYSKADELISQLGENSYNYEAHKSLVKIYEQTGNLDKLREARETFHKYYPLTEDLWMDWLNDEKGLAETDQEKEAVLNLFKRASKDYLSLNIWVEYCSYAIGLGNTHRVREIMLDAINSIGYSTTDGKLIWDLNIEYEAALLAALKTSDNKDKQSLVDEQSNRLLKLYQRLMSIPLVGISSLPEEYKNLTEAPPPQQILESHKTALDCLSKTQPFEQQLESVGSDGKLDVYNKYIKFYTTTYPEQHLCIICLYERAISDVPLDSQLWIHYTQYLEKNVALTDRVLPVYERALRNVPWSGSIWSSCCQQMEKQSHDADKITAQYELALGSGLSSAADYLLVYQFYCDFIRRQTDFSDQENTKIEELRSLFQRAIEFLLKYYGEEGDSECTLPKYWALIEAKHLNNITRGREIWNESLTGWRNSRSQAWLEYVQYERQYGDNKHTRRVLQRALKSVTDYPDSICCEYIRFEREEGTLDHLYIAQTRTAEIRSQLAEKDAARAKYQKKFPQQKKFQNPRFGNKEQNLDKKKKDGERKEKADNKKKKQKTSPPKNQSSLNNQTDGEVKVFKRKKTGDMGPPALPAISGNNIQTEFKTPPDVASGDGEPASKRPKQDSEAKPESQQVSGTETEVRQYKDEQTVFVSNLSYDIDEQMLKLAFNKCGGISGVRIMKAAGNKSKGFGYVEFDNIGSVKSALELDRQILNNRPMYVSECKQDRGDNKKIKFDTGLEKNKLFISDLSRDTSKEDLQQIFIKYGSLKDVRIVTYRGGVSKGLAYIEYHNEADAKRALLEEDDREVKGHKIKVEISCPPPRKPVQTNQSSSFVKSLGGVSRQQAEQQPRGRAKTQLSLVPRVTAMKSQAKPTTTEKIKPEPQASLPDTETASAQKMSNKDFRDMLLNKK